MYSLNARIARMLLKFHLRMLHTIRTIGAMADTVPALSAKKKLNLMVMSMTKLRLVVI